MRKIALKSIRGKKRETRLLAGMLVLLYAVSFMLVIFAGSFKKTLEENRFENYGEWSGAAIGADINLKDTLETQKDVYSIGAMETGGNVRVEGKECGKVGTVDKTARELARMELEDGKWPETETEAALPASIVKQLDGTVDIGDKVSLDYAEGSRKSGREVILTGIIKTWGTDWTVDRSLLPSVIQGKNSKTGAEGDNSIIYFFKTSDMNAGSLNNLSARIGQNSEAEFVFNEKAYPRNMSLAATLSEDGKQVMFLILVSTIIIGYLLTVFAKNERYSLLILRGLGAGRGQILLLALWKCVYFLGFSVFAGAMVGSVGSIALLGIVKSVLGVSVFYEIKWLNILQIGGACAIIFVMGYLGMAMQVCMMEIMSSYKEDSERYEKKVLDIKRAECHTIKSMIKRNRRFYRDRIGFRAGISIIVIVISAVCTYLFIKSESDYRFWKEQKGYNYLFHTPDLTEGISDVDIDKIKDIPGIDSAEYEKFLNCSGKEQMITISWNSWKDSEYVRTYRRYAQVHNSTEPYDKEGDYFTLNEIRGVSPQDKERLSGYQDAVEDGELDKEAFNEGEECILFLSPYQIRDVGTDIIDKEPVYIDPEGSVEKRHIYTYEEDNPIQPGTYITISSPWGTQEIKVGGIIYAAPEYGEQVIAVGERFLDKLCGIEDENLYNSVRFPYSEDADFEEMDIAIADFFSTVHNGEGLVNERNIYEEIRGQLVSDIFRMVVIITAVWLLYLLIMYQGNAGHLNYERKRIGILQTLGISKSDLKKMYYYEYLYESVIITGAGGLICSAWFIYRLRVATSFDSMKTFKHAVMSNMGDLSDFAFSVLTAVVVCAGISLITIHVPVKRILRNSIITNIRRLQ